MPESLPDTERVSPQCALLGHSPVLPAVPGWAWGQQCPNTGYSCCAVSSCSFKQVFQLHLNADWNGGHLHNFHSGAMLVMLSRFLCSIQLTFKMIVYLWSSWTSCSSQTYVPYRFFFKRSLKISGRVLILYFEVSKHLFVPDAVNISSLVPRWKEVVINSPIQYQLFFFSSQQYQKF